MVTQALSMRKEVDALPHPLRMQTERVCDVILQNRQMTIYEVAY